MRTVRLTKPNDYAEWRDQAKALLVSGTRPDEVFWVTAESADMLSLSEPSLPLAEDLYPISASDIRVPRGFLDFAATILCHSDPVRFSLLYRLLYRLQDQKILLSDLTDPDVIAAQRMERAVRHDCHNMMAFVRFKEVATDESATTEGLAGDTSAGRRRFFAWYEPDHYIVQRTASFFRRRFSDMDWVILTPKGSSRSIAGHLEFDPTPAEKPDTEDSMDDLWRTYYANIFNPARLRVRTMRNKMPQRFWSNLPEAEMIPELISTAGARARTMTTAAPSNSHLADVFGAADLGANFEVPDSLDALNDAIRVCTRCPLHCAATQAVVGEGPGNAPLMIVGEQPGDQEDLIGRPFVGPAGELLGQVMETAALDRNTVYVTNAVKHFKFEQRGKRRIHQNPNADEIQHCRWWLHQEVGFVRPKVILAMGVSALHSVTGKRQTLRSMRGRTVTLPGEMSLLATVHPSYLLRVPDPAKREQETALFLNDIRDAKLRAFGSPSSGSPIA